MTEKQLRDFYELCQIYRHTPVTEFVAVSEAYDSLTKFVQKEIAQARRDALEFARNCVVLAAVDAYNVWDSESAQQIVIKATSTMLDKYDSMIEQALAASERISKGDK